MSILSDTKELVKLIQQLGNVDLYQKIVNLQSEILELTEENRNLKERLQKKEKMVFRKPFWYREGDETPHCPKCWEAEEKTIHLIGPSDSDIGPSYECPHCKQFFHPEYKGRKGGPHTVDYHDI